MVFLVDTSDSFNKLDNSSSAAGNVVLEKWIMPLLKKGKFNFPTIFAGYVKSNSGKYNSRTAPTTVTVIQFSGMGPDKNYVPGSKGVAVKGKSYCLTHKLRFINYESLFMSNKCKSNIWN